MSDDTPNRPRCVAVVAVHGVADQQPNATARVIADLLSRVTGETGGRYRAFEETDLRLPVRPVVTRAVDAARAGASVGPDASPAPPPAASLFAMSQSTQQIRATVPESQGAKREPPDLADTLAHNYMTELLSAYRPDVKDQVYETIRLESVRNSPSHRIHLHEAYWADLSRLESGLLSAVLDLYQLMFYVCSLGRKTIEQAENKSRWWSAFGWAHALVEWPLVLGVPILNLVLLMLAAVIFTIKIPPTRLAIAGIGSVVVGTALAAGFAIYWKRMRFSGSQWPVTGILVVMLATIFGGFGYLVFGHGGAYRSLGLITFLLLAIPYLWLMAAYQRRRHGAFPVALIAVALVALDFAYQVYRAGGTGPDALVGAVLRSMEAVLWCLQQCWIVVLVGIVLTAVVGALAVRFGTADGRRARAAWTANLSAVLPTVIVIILNLAVWSWIHAAGTWIVPELESTKQRTHVEGSVATATTAGAVAVAREKPALIAYEPRLPGVSFGAMVAGDAIAVMLNRAAQPLWVIAPVTFVALLWAVWSLLPSIAAEFPGLVKPGVPAAVWLGDALSAGFRAMRLSGELLRLIFFALLGLGGLVGLGIVSETRLAGLPTVAGFLGAAVTLAITASKGPFRFLALGFRSALDVALDVTNWLRKHPLERNPRARICARYVSLLRHLCRWTDPADGSRYDAIVIIAHSQGTVITADLLRFLQKEQDPELARLYSTTDRLPIYLFTMGCPLRQLYGLRFPHLYGWAWHDATTWPGTRPDPAALGVAMWANVFRSGDYVGRYLWFPDADPGRWSKRQTTATHHVFEGCLGAGAHTHYWDQPAPDTVGKALDAILAVADADLAVVDLTR